MGIKKNFFAPLALGLGATRRAAILLLVMMLTTATAWATDKTLSGSESYTAQDGDVLTGSTSGTVTIADNASITLSDVTITGGIVCAGTAEITLVGTNSVTGFSGYDPNINAVRYTAGIQVGGSSTTLTIKGNGSLTANGALHSAGIGLSRAWKVDATGGDIVIEGGNITATGDGMGAGIGTGVCFGGDSNKTATLGNITIKGGTVRAIGGTDNGNGIGKGHAYSNGHAVVGTITIYDGIDMVDASSISESVTYMYGETNVTANKTDYFTITEDGNRRVIFPKDDTDYTITIADGIEHGTIACEATTAKLGANVTITATPDQGYIFSRLVVKDAQNNDVESTGNSFIMPRSNVSVSADFAEDPYNGTCGDGVYYAYDSSTYTLNIFGTGAISNRPWDSYACDIQTVVIGSGVTSIGDHAFNGCYYLESVTVYAPSCSLGEDAFDGCDNLANIYVFSNLVDTYKAAWSDYTSIITGITGGYCGATGHETDVVWVLTGESTNYTLTISGTGAMNDYYPDINPAPWNSYAEQIREVVIEKYVTSIGNFAFSECRTLESVTFAEGSQLTSIGDGAFDGTALTSIEIPASVTSIGVDAFSSCDYLESVTFAEGSQLTSIGDGAFASSDLTSITIPASVTSIGEDVFLNCDNLASMAVADGNTVYDSRNGCNAIIEKSTNTLIIGCKNSTIPAGVTSIGAWAFGVTGLTSIEIPASVTSIGDYAFGATGLTSVEIPASVTSIGRCAFQNCLNLATVTVYAPSCSLGEDAFANCNELANIYVFSDLVDGYKDAENWSSYEDKITEMPNPNGKCGDNVRWALTGESTNYTLTITGSGAMANYASSSVQPWNDYRSSIKTVVIGNGVTSIGERAFYNTGLTSIDIPASVTSIGNYTFAKCTGLTSIEIPASVTSIGDDAFWNCSNLATVTFAEDSQLATIGISAFNSCRGLASVEIPASVTSIGERAFSGSSLGSVTFADGSRLESIGNYAFDNTGLTSIEIPASVTSIGERAFYGTGLTSIEIPASVTSIGGSAFANCSNLEAITVDGGNTVYDSRNGCNAIIVKSTNTLIIGCKNSTIPASVTSIDNSAFYATGLTSIEIPAGVTSIGSYAFANTGLTSVEIPASVTSIGSYVFSSCNGLGSVTFAEGSQLTSIGSYAFANTGLTSIEIPAGVTSIGIYAFANTGLTSIEIPASVTNIRGYAFENCPNLATVTVYALECRLGEDAFNNCTKLENIYVFSDLVDDYKTATNWKKYMGKITALPTVTTSYVDATGTLHEGVQAIPLNNVMTTLPAGTYVVNSDVAYTGTITLYGDVNIILADGKTMTASGGNYGIYGYGGGPLTIYGQALGTGILTVTSTNDVGIRVVDGVTINGGTVNATGIFSDGDVTINGGKVTSTIDPGICSNNGTITLGLRNATDYITAESYSASLGIIVKAGQTLTDGISTYSGTLTDEQKIAIAEKVLTPPTYSVTANRATKEDTEYWSTFYHPAAGYTADENTTVYQAAVNTTTNKVELTAVPGREIPADKAVVLKSTQSAITLSRATTTQTLDGNELKGGSTVADGKVPYTLAAKDGMVGFYKFVGAALNPNKAHLEITAPAQSAPAFFGFEENTTAINEHELHESHELSGAWYSLDGRKLSGKPSVKGIYVRNGRKFIIK